MVVMPIQLVMSVAWSEPYPALQFPSFSLLAEFVAERANSFFYELLDWGTIIFEVGMLLSVISLKWFRRLLVCAVGFHVSVLLILNIAFWGNFPAYAAFVPWASGAN